LRYYLIAFFCFSVFIHSRFSPLKILFSSFFFLFFCFFFFFIDEREAPIGRYRLSRWCSQMSIVPLVFRNWWDDVDRPVSRLLDQHFGTGLHRDDLISSLSGLGIDRPSLRSIFGNTYYRPWGNVTRQNSSGSSTIQLAKDNFQVGICRSVSHGTKRQRNRTPDRGAIRSKVNLRISCFLRISTILNYVQMWIFTNRIEFFFCSYVSPSTEQMLKYLTFLF
jgi:hypothetical protein